MRVLWSLYDRITRNWVCVRYNHYEATIYTNNIPGIILVLHLAWSIQTIERPPPREDKQLFNQRRRVDWRQHHINRPRLVRPHAKLAILFADSTRERRRRALLPSRLQFHSLRWIPLTTHSTTRNPSGDRTSPKAQFTTQHSHNPPLIAM